jgi:hypothetical protein
MGNNPSGWSGQEGDVTGGTLHGNTGAAHEDHPPVSYAGGHVQQHEQYQQRYQSGAPGQHYTTTTDATLLFSRKLSMQRAATVDHPSALDQVVDVLHMQRAASGFLLHRGPSTVHRMSTSFLDDYGGLNSQGGGGDTEIDVVTDHDPMLPDVSLEINLHVSGCTGLELVAVWG